MEVQHVQDPRRRIYERYEFTDNFIPDPGFEQVPSGWTLGTTCPVGTAVIQGGVVRSGALALAITRAAPGGIQRCGYAERLITGLTPGLQYLVKIWNRTAATSGSVTAVIYIDGAYRGAMTSNTLTWVQTSSAVFTVPGTSANLRIGVLGNGSIGSHTRYFDDLEWKPA